MKSRRAQHAPRTLKDDIKNSMRITTRRKHQTKPYLASMHSSGRSYCVMLTENC